ncbi:MAG: Fic family protein [Dysgonamonadaceae bacterium]|jgi:Fic family protein|nr:Fic family protein [Dysgonamonadaceae bacterium]
MDKFIKKLHFDFRVNQRVLLLIGILDGFKGKWNIVEKWENRYLKELRRIATIESIGSSTRIEGATLTDKEVQELLENIRITKMQTRDEQEVVGYYEVLELIFDNYADLKLSESHIKQLHQLLLKYSHKDGRHRGCYKHLSNKVVATYPTGEQRTVFATTEPALVESEMHELLEWVNEQLIAKEIHPLLIIALFVYEFLSIHPFQDGNGRLSRLLTTLCLLQNGYEFIQYVSFEKHVEQHKKAYYEALMSGQRNRNTGNEQISLWMLFFLESLKSLTEKLEQKYNVFKQKGGYLNERQKQIADFIAQNQPVKVGDISAHFKEIPINTIKKDLQYLRDEQILAMIGKGKACVYVISDK